MGRDRPVPPLVDLVEGMIAQDEREGGKTQRALAISIVQAVVHELVEQGVEVGCHFHAEGD